MRRALTLLLLLVAPALLFTRPAHAVGQSLGPEPHDVFEGTMNYAATAGSLLECGGGASCDLNTGGNCQGLDTGTAPLQGIPVLPGLRVAYAQLNWVASLADGDAPDTEVTLTPPGGAPIAARSDPARSEQFDDAADAGSCQTVQLLCSVGSCALTFSSQVADITDALNTHLESGGVLNGDWRIDDVVIPGGDDNDPGTAIAAIGSLTIGGWSLLIVYEEASLPLRRIYYYQGFELISGGERRLHPAGFRAPPDPALDLTFFAMEGDEGTVGDGIRVNDTDLEDACNPYDNVFNDTVNAGGRCTQGTRGVDLDQFHLEDALEAGDEEADITITLPRGDGLITAGEQIFTDWLVIAFDHRPANFDTLKPEKSAEPPSRTAVQSGQEIEYTILVENSGGEDATGVIIRDAPPAGTTYVAGSTTVDIIQIPDDDGTTVLAQGLLLTGVPGIPVIGPMERHLVKFRVTVDAGLANGTILTNIASITADGVAEVRTDPVVHSVGVLPDGGFPPPQDASVPRPDARPDLDGGVERLDMSVVPDAAPVICGPGQVVNGQGQCVDDTGDAEPERDACPFGNSQGPCGPGTRFVDNACVAICGEGTYWDTTCDNGCGRCQPDGVPTCAEAEGGGGGASDEGCGCQFNGRGAPIPLFALALTGLALARRRRNRNRNRKNG